MERSEKSNLKTNIFLIIFLIILIIVTILSVIFPDDIGNLFAIGNWFNEEVLASYNYWLAIGFTMLLCFLGALIPIPIPYMLPVALFTVAWVNTYSFAWVLIIGLVLFSALSNTIGDIIDYYIGRGTEYVLSQENPEMENRWSKIILYKPKLIPGVILIFGASPLPESLLMIPLGIAKYDIKKTFFWMFLGKIVMMTLMAGFGILGIVSSSEGESSIFDIFDSPIIGIGVLFIIWIMIVFMVKYKPKKQ
ncbi:MAG: VTT domain-containing protein [Promethearchaeota archaeon]